MYGEIIREGELVLLDSTYGDSIGGVGELYMG